MGVSTVPSERWTDEWARVGVSEIGLDLDWVLESDRVRAHRPLSPHINNCVTCHQNLYARNIPNTEIRLSHLLFRLFPDAAILQETRFATRKGILNLI